MGRQNPYKRPDRFTREGKERGFPAGSVFKLEDIDRKVSLFRKGQRVLDLGAAPGSWSLYAGERIGPTGKLLAIDLNPLAKAAPPRIMFRAADALALDSADLSLFAPYDVVLRHGAEHDRHAPGRSGEELRALRASARRRSSAASTQLAPSGPDRPEKAAGTPPEPEQGRRRGRNATRRRRVHRWPLPFGLPIRSQ